MPINVISVISKRSYDFSNGSATIVERKAVDVTSATSGALLVRLHDKAIGSGGSVTVVVKVSAPSDEQPETDFVGDAVATVTIDSAPALTAPALLKVDLSPEFGGFLWVEVQGTQGSASTQATISADLAMKV